MNERSLELRILAARRSTDGCGVDYFRLGVHNVYLQDIIFVLVSIHSSPLNSCNELPRNHCAKLVERANKASLIKHSRSYRVACRNK